MTLPDPDIVPDPLLNRDQWIIWRSEWRCDDHTDCSSEHCDEGEWTKVPYQTNGDTRASSTDPETWDSFETARNVVEFLPGEWGLGYVFDPASPIVGIDLDKCRDDNGIDDWALEIVNTLDSYTHVSTSGTGLHVFCLGSIPDGGNRKGDLEMYDKERFFAFTGDHIPGTPMGLNQRNDEIRAVWEEYIDTDEEETGSVENDGGSSSGEVHDVSLDAEEIIEKAKNADYKGDTFNRLFERGDTSQYPSHSEADSALCCILAWWTGHDEQLMDEIFRESALMREKWDEDRGGNTYGEITLDAATNKVTGSYDPDRGSDDDDPDVDPSAFERESTTSMKVFSEAIKHVDPDDVNIELEGSHIQRVEDRWMDTESGKTFDTISLVAWLEGLTETPTENVEGRADWIELGHALRFRGADVPRFKPTGGVARSTSSSAGWSQ